MHCEIVPQRQCKVISERGAIRRHISLVGIPRSGAEFNLHYHSSVPGDVRLRSARTSAAMEVVHRLELLKQSGTKPKDMGYKPFKKRKVHGVTEATTKKWLVDSD